MSDPHLELYELHGCPYCRRVTRAGRPGPGLRPHPVPGSRRNRGEGKPVSGRCGVPVLIDRTNGIEGMAESDDIVRYIYEEYGDPEDAPTSTGLLGGLT